MTRMPLVLSTIAAAVVMAVTAAAWQAPAAPAPGDPPQITLGPGLRPVPDYRKVDVPLPAPKIPDGFTSIFNGRDLTGWHVSTDARHGTTPDFHVDAGMILGTQRPFGRGGLLITDRKYRDFEFYMEVKPDWGNDSGVFFRTTEAGAAYQITMDYLPGGSMGRLISEGGIAFGPARPAAPARAATAGTARTAGTAGAGAPASPAAAPARGGQAPDPGMAAWKREDWNTVRVRIVGDVPHGTVWINDVQVSDASDTENHAVGGMVEGPIAIQVHGGGVRWQPGGFWRWRNLAIKQVLRN